MTIRGDQLVSDYLERLDQAAQGLPPDRRTELLHEISEHIESARAAGAAADEAAVRTMLDRLGDPAEIVASAYDDHPAAQEPLARWPGAPAVIESRPSTVLETWAVVMLTAGSLLPIVGWLVGVVLLWLSARWRWWEKLIGTLIVPFGPGLVLLAAAFLPGGVTSCTSGGTVRGPHGAIVQQSASCTSSGPPQWLLTSLVFFALAAPIVVAVVLLKVARRRATLEPPVLTPVWAGAPAGTTPWGGIEIAAVACLGVGPFVVPVIAPMVGLVLAWSSPRWTDREKATATVIAVVPFFLLFLGLLAVV